MYSNFKRVIIVISLVNCFFSHGILKSQELEKGKEYLFVTVAFYNIENLFDTLDTENVDDEEFTPLGAKNWNSEKYNLKLEKLSEVLSQLGTEINPDGPALLGLCEIENKSVLEDLAKTEKLKSKKYNIVHYDSPDRRGVDVGFLYQPKYFEVTGSKPFTLKMEGDDGFLTRDQLLVSGKLLGENIHIIVNHWPSRRGGEKKSAPKRMAAADLGRSIIDSLLAADPNAKIMLMGDLNDDPVDESVKKHLKTVGEKDKLKNSLLFNPMESLHKKGIGSLAYRDSWNLFDQIIISSSLFKGENSTFRFYTAKVFNKEFLKNQEGQYKGYPFRTFVGNAFQNGYSDHFPVYIFLVKEK